MAVWLSFARRLAVGGRRRAGTKLNPVPVPIVIGSNRLDGAVTKLGKKFERWEIRRGSRIVYRRQGQGHARLHTGKGRADTKGQPGRTNTS